MENLKKLLEKTSKIQNSNILLDKYNYCFVLSLIVSNNAVL